ncbi:uncharacterized protein LOC121738482 [Aricia agestis]|uniref:uncharacterized protein LOC121738482 n=1 Tax=Aricia agestis TaxID=91739 RepID=UPI001C208DC6|nr:uncharacterized protein LOC121738482 [Aricia agestis]
MISLFTKKVLIDSNVRNKKLFPYLRRFVSKEYSDEQKARILEVINADTSDLLRYDISKIRHKKFTKWIAKNGQLKSIDEIEKIEGFSEKTAIKLFDSIVDTTNNSAIAKKLKGQVLNPPLSESIQSSCKSVLAIHVTMYSVCWTLIRRSRYEVEEWKYYKIDYPDGRKMQLPDIYNIAADVTNQLPVADVYVMKAEATTLRAAGSDPNNPKMLGVNLQKAQMIAMIVALVNSRESSCDKIGDDDNKVHFLRPTLPFRLYGTLVGNERVSTDQAVELLLQDSKVRTSDYSKVYVPEHLQAMFRRQEELLKDMLGQCLLLALTFMDVCVYLNVDSISKLLKSSQS